jgi:uncharacterized membrane protein
MTDPPAAASASGRWDTDRLEAFSDGVMAVIITIMAFGLEAPNGTSWNDLGKRLPDLLIYALSFTFIGIYWNNHHHLFRATERISGAVMWANLHVLFWLSLIPVLTKWIGTDYRAHVPACAYGVVALGAAAAYGILVQAIIRANGKDSAVAAAIGSDLKGTISIGLYAVGVGLAWVSPWISYALYVAVAVVWFVPDRRFTRAHS